MTGAPRFVTTAARPDLAPLVARWLWDAFWRESGTPFETLLRLSFETAAAAGPIPKTFVALAGEEPAATASLIAHDLDERPDLTPWLAGVFVAPQFRGRGLAAPLVRAVEHAARDTGVATLWLHTKTAAPLYAKLGWAPVGVVTAGGAPSTLMRRHFVGSMAGRSTLRECSGE